MKKVLIGALTLIISSELVFASVITGNNKKLNLNEVRKSSVEAVRKMYNKKRDVALHVGNQRGYASCELYLNNTKGTCTVQFPARDEVITKCVGVFRRGRNNVTCHATNLMFFFPNTRRPRLGRG